MSERIRDLSAAPALDELRRAAVAIVYKHSPRCPVSWGAQREIERFVSETPDVPVFVVNVVQDRSLSRALAEELAVRHESPQVIMLQSGNAVRHASHHQITARLLGTWVDEIGS
jgi:bacillithiol system protein YtxJ